MAHLPCLVGVVLLLQSQPYQSPIPLLLIVLTILGAVADYRYKKAGGRRPSKKDRILFLVVGLALLGFIVWAASMNSRIAGMILLPLLTWLFFAWEVGRWRMRRKYPLPKKPEQTAAD